MTNTTTTRRFLAQPGRSALYGKLFELLKTHEPNTLTDEQITAAVGVPCDVRSKKGYGVLLRVMRALLGEGICWTREPGAACIMRRSSEYLAKSAPNRVRKVRRCVRRETRTLACAKLGELPDDAKKQILSAQSALGIAALSVEPSTMKKIEVRQTVAMQTDPSAVMRLLMDQ